MTSKPEVGGRIYLANVGANAAHRFAGPIFPDGSFEFLPIPEDRDLSGPHPVRYRDLVSHNRPGEDLLRFIPERLAGWPAHNDPEFDTFTYGDRCRDSPRAASLMKLAPGDILFFIVRLATWESGRPTGEHGFYLVGYLEIESVLRDVVSRPSEADLARFGANAHIRRGLSDPVLWDGFWVFAGSERSRRFPRAVPVVRDLADSALTRADGAPWTWGGGRTDLQVIGSYTRSCRCIIDPARAGSVRRRAALWDWVERHGGGLRPADEVDPGPRGTL